MPVIDLHSHSSYSDGTSRPSELVVESCKRQVALFSLTDHDTVAGVKEAGDKCAKYKIKFVTGVEISTKEHDYLHFLAYKISPDNEKFEAFLAENRKRRTARIKKTIAQLASAGVDITEEEVFAKIKNTASRAHVADALRAKKIVQTRQEAFKKYLVPGAAGYVEPMGVGVAETIRMIKDCGGLAVIAHPGLTKDVWDFKSWTDAGLDGIEVFYPSHREAMRQELLSIAREYNLFATAGSDNHGPKSSRDSRPGMEIPPLYYDMLIKRLEV
ncbi:hypothetical protein Dip518_001303 [Parelusimicrobium proximum]|uniref:PHP domain-containing protein n=1 Tax=Parelusimicrobium proximum TaxID=3228953 RepID=UPI003D17538F